MGCFLKKNRKLHDSPEALGETSVESGLWLPKFTTKSNLEVEDMRRRGSHSVALLQVGRLRKPAAIAT